MYEPFGKVHKNPEEKWESDKRAGFIKKELDKEINNKENSIE